MNIRVKYKNAATQQGASLVEFAVVAPVLFLMGLGTLQAGLLYHNKTILNYATYEAARVGATRHAQHQLMRLELGIRLAPLIGGDGTLEKAAAAMVQTAINVESPIGITGAIAPPTKLEILSPDLDAFANWGEDSVEHINRRVIPNSHLRHQGSEVRGGVSLADANLLKIEVTHGMEMKVPLVSKLLSRMMLVVDDDPERRLYYLSERFPLKSTATVRMQSEAWKGAIVAAADKPFGEIVARLSDIAEDIESSVADAIDGEGGTGDCGEDGLGPDEPTSSPVAAPENDLSFLQSQSEDELIASGQVCLAPPPVDPEGTC